MSLQSVSGLFSTEEPWSVFQPFFQENVPPSCFVCFSVIGPIRTDLTDLLWLSLFCRQYFGPGWLLERWTWWVHSRAVVCWLQVDQLEAVFLHELWHRCFVHDWVLSAAVSFPDSSCVYHVTLCRDKTEHISKSLDISRAKNTKKSPVLLFADAVLKQPSASCLQWQARAR